MLHECTRVSARFLLIFSLASLCALCWSYHGPAQSRSKDSVRNRLPRVLKPRCPDDCPACRLASPALEGAGPVPAPVRPWCEVKSRRGVPKHIDTQGFACPNPQCPYLRVTDACIHALVGDGKHGRAERIQTFRCQACRITFSARLHTPLYRLKTPSQQIAMVLSALAEGLDPPLPSGSSAFDKPPSRPGCSVLASTHTPCTSASSAICASRTCSWMKCAPGCVAPDKCSGCGWQSILAPSCFPCSIWVRAPNIWHIYLSTLYEIAWPPFCLPLFTSDGLNLYFYALTAHFGQWLEGGRRGRPLRRWQVAAGLIYGQVKKSYHRRKLVGVSKVMRLGTQDALQAALQGLGFSGRLNTAFIERVNLTVRHGVAALARRTWATA
jgi:transposase-like protein